MKLQRSIQFLSVAAVSLGIGFLAGRWARAPADEAKLTFASYGNASVQGSEVLARIQPQLQQLEQSKYALKKRVSDELLLQRLSPAEKNELQALQAHENQRPFVGAAPEATDEDVLQYMKEKKYDPAKLSTADFESIKRTLSTEKAEKLTSSQKAVLEKSVSLKRIRYGIPRTRGPLVELPEPRVAFQGPSGAAVEIVVVSNFNCATCSASHRRLAELKHRYPEKLKISFLLQTGDGEDSLAHMTGEAALCANEQKEFWKYYDILFQKPLESERDLLLASYTAKLDTTAFEKCFRERRYKPAIAAEIQATVKLGIEAPAFVINGEVLAATESLGVLSDVIDSEL